MERIKLDQAIILIIISVLSTHNMQYITLKSYLNNIHGIHLILKKNVFSPQDITPTLVHLKLHNKNIQQI